jgi:hypothetical protein
MIRNVPEIRALRAAVHTFVVGSVIGIVMALVPGHVRFITGGVILLLLVALSIGLEWYGRRPIAVFARDHSSVYSQSIPLSQLMSAAETIRIIGGTLLTLTDRDANLDALRSKRDVRVLLMHPEGFGIEAAERNRALYHDRTTYDLKSECRRSLLRLRESLGADRIFECVRLYRAMPTTSIYRLDNHYVLTCYIFGRGGGSPSLLVRRARENEGFCNKLDEAFDTLWRATEPLTRNSYDRIMSGVSRLDLPAESH